MFLFRFPPVHGVGSPGERLPDEGSRQVVLHSGKEKQRVSLKWTTETMYVTSSIETLVQVSSLKTADNQAAKAEPLGLPQRLGARETYKFKEKGRRLSVMVFKTVIDIDCL